jgi:hypothetical protein
MTRRAVRIRWDMGPDDYGSFANQTITNIHVDDQGYAFGSWNGRLVGAYHVDSFVWYVIDWL